MFINNKYTNYYTSLIASALNRVLDKSVYTEKHHIIPKCMGGKDDLSNLVKLTAKEHFIAHMLLVRMTEGVYHRKMSFALWRMTQERSDRNSRHKVTATQYESIKTLMAHNMSVHNKGQQLTPEQQKRQQAGCARRGGPWNKGKKMPPEFGQAVSQRRLGTKASAETSQSISKGIKKWNETRKGTDSSLKGRKIPRYTTVVEHKLTHEQYTTTYFREWLAEHGLKPHHIHYNRCDYRVIRRFVTSTGKDIPITPK